MLKLNQYNTLRCGNQVIDISIPIIMGILNLTDDSFYPSSRVEATSDSLVEKARKMIQEGAAILDIGGQSTRPGATMISPKEELDKLIPAITMLKTEFPATPISVDTFRSEVAKGALSAGATIINDVSGFEWDNEMLEVLEAYKPIYVLMHSPSTIEGMHVKDLSTDPIRELSQYFTSKLRTLYQAGVREIILDPGFGFGKTHLQNLALIDRLSAFSWLGHPVLAGISRKSSLSQITGRDTNNTLNATSALHMLALEKGARVLRVHDVEAARDVISVFLNVKQTRDSE